MYDRIQEKAKQYPIVSSDCSVCLIHICHLKKRYASLSFSRDNVVCLNFKVK